jgi:hypothetical protein
MGYGLWAEAADRAVDISISYIAELAETRFAGGYPAFHNHIEPYLAVWTR